MADRPSAFRMAALVGALATAGGAGYVASRTTAPAAPAITDKQAASALIDRLEDERFRRTVEQVARARGLEVPRAASAPATARASAPARGWPHGPPTLEQATCPVHGVPGVPIAAGEGGIYVSTADARIRWALVDDRPGRAPVDPLEHVVLYVAGPDVPYVRVHYRDWWTAGNGIADLEADALRPIPGLEP